MTQFPLSVGRERDSVRHELKRRPVTLIRREELTETLTRFTFASEELRDFTSQGPEDHVKMFFPSGDETVGRDYTPSRYRSAGLSGLPELDIDMVIHGDSGPATAWASTAQPGATLQIGGPKGSRLAPQGFRNAVFLADPTGFPALRRWVLTYRGVLPVQAILFGDDRTALQYFRDDELPNLFPFMSSSDELPTMVQTRDIDQDTFVWAAGEANALAPVRRLLKERGLGKPNVSLHGYWREGDAGLGDHIQLDPADPE